MNGYVIPLLILLLMLQLGSLSIGFVLWWRHVGLVARVTRLEAFQENSLTHAEMRAICERLASIEGQIKTTNQLMQTVQTHLLESEQ